MYENWYKLTSKKREPIILSDNESFQWKSVRNIDGSYSIVTVVVGNKKYNFYLWSAKTVKTAQNFYNEKKFKKSLNILKKYSFEVKIQEANDDS